MEWKNMCPELTDVKGLGKKAETLIEAGIDTVEKLANSKKEDLTDLKGIGEATAEKLIESAKELLEPPSEEETEDKEAKAEESEDESEEDEEQKKKIEEELKRLEEKKKQLQGKKVQEGDFVLVKLTGKTQKGNVFRVSSEEDAKKAGMYEEEKAQQGYYTPEFVIVGKQGFLNEGLTETIQEMNYFEKKSVRIPPTKAFGKRDPQKIERISIGKFRKLNEGKNPEIGQDFTNKKGQRGVVSKIVQGRVIVDYNHPLAGQSIDYNLEIVDKIEGFDEKIHYFMINKGIPKSDLENWQITHDKETKTIEFVVPKNYMFQNLTYFKFGLSMDLQQNLADDIGDVKFVEIFEKIPIPQQPADSIMKKVEEFNKEREESEEDSQTTEGSD